MSVALQRINSGTTPISPIDDIIAEAAAGRLVIMVDDENRENEGDLVIPADHVTPEIINFMITYGRGLVCMPLEQAMIDRLGLKPMVADNTSKFSTAFTVSIGAQEGVTTGISAHDRAQTVKVAIDPQSGPDDISMPGHVFPLIARDGGVLERNGHTEAAIDIAKLAGCSGAAVICEIIKDDGTMARLADLEMFAAQHDMKIGTIADLVAYRSK